MAQDYSFMSTPQRGSGSNTGWTSQPQYNQSVNTPIQSESQGGMNQWTNPGLTNVNQPETGGNNSGAIFNQQPFNFNFGQPTQAQFTPPNAPTQYNPFGTGGIFAGQMGLTPGSFQNKNEPVARFLENWGFPAATMQQNMNQFNQQMAAANYQYGMNYNQTAQNNLFNQQLAAAQHNAGLATGQQAQQNWGAQFGHQQALDAWNQQFATGQAATAANQFNQQFGLQQQLGMGNLGVAQQGAQTAAAQQAAQQALWQSQAGLGQQAHNLAALQNTQQFGLQSQIANSGTWDQQQAAAHQAAQLAQQGSQFGQQFGLQQQIANAGTWDQQQAAALQAAQLAQQGSQFGQTFGLQQQQLAQQAALAREQMTNEQRMASMSAFGRATAPSASYVSSWA